MIIKKNYLEFEICSARLEDYYKEGHELLKIKKPFYSTILSISDMRKMKTRIALGGD